MGCNCGGGKRRKRRARDVQAEVERLRAKRAVAAKHNDQKAYGKYTDEMKALLAKETH